MFKELMQIIIEGITIITIMIAPAGIAGTIETQYSQVGMVIEENHHILTIEDSCGECWEYKSEDFHLNDKVKITFWNHATDNTRKDDEIIRLKKVK